MTASTPITNRPRRSTARWYSKPAVTPTTHLRLTISSREPAIASSFRIISDPRPLIPFGPPPQKNSLVSDPSTVIEFVTP